MAQKIVPESNKWRAENLTDGIFATVMTILVLNLVVPVLYSSNPTAELGADLQALIPTIFTYIITFILLGSLWLRHHNLFSHLTGMNRQLQWLNMLLLLAVGFAPFSTALLGRYPAEQLAVIIYGVNMLIISILFNMLWLYPRSAHLTYKESKKYLAQTRLMAFIGPCLYVLAILLSYVFAEISLGIYALVTIFYIASGSSYYIE